MQKSEILNERAFKHDENDRMMNEMAGVVVDTPSKGARRPLQMSAVVPLLQNTCTDSSNPVTSLGTKSEPSNPASFQCGT